MESKGQYYPLWEKNRASIIKAIIYGGGKVALSKSDLTPRGERKSYSFRIEYKNGQPTKRGGSAVARDLQDILEKDSSFYTVVAGKEVVIRMGVSFELEVIVTGDCLSNEDIAYVGKVILHKKFGSGTIESIDGDNVMVNFGTETVKLNYKFALGKGIIETKK